MKKVILSSILILVFTAYTLYVRIIGIDVPVALTPEPNKGKVALTLPVYTTPKPTSSIPSSPTSLPPPTTQPIINTGKYQNGNYIGDEIDAYYGYVQVKAIISGGKITDVQFLNYPQDRQTSIRINSRAMPYLISEAITLQDSNVATVSGASFTSTAYRKSLASALLQARN